MASARATPSAEEHRQASVFVDVFRQAADELAACNVVFQALPWECSDPEVYRALVSAGVLLVRDASRR